MWATDLAFPPISQHLKNAPGPADIFFPKNWIYLKPHSRSSWWLLVVGCLVLQEHHWKPEAIEVPCKSKDSWSEEQMDSWAKGRKGRKDSFSPEEKKLWVVRLQPSSSKFGLLIKHLTFSCNIMCDNLFKYNSGSTPSHTIPKMVIDNQPPGTFLQSPMYNVSLSTGGGGTVDKLTIWTGAPLQLEQ